MSSKVSVRALDPRGRPEPRPGDAESRPANLPDRPHRQIVEHQVGDGGVVEVHPERHLFVAVVGGDVHALQRADIRLQPLPVRAAHGPVIDAVHAVALRVAEHVAGDEPVPRRVVDDGRGGGVVFEPEGPRVLRARVRLLAPAERGEDARRQRPNRRPAHSRPREPLAIATSSARRRYHNSPRPSALGRAASEPEGAGAERERAAARDRGCGNCGMRSRRHVALRAGSRSRYGCGRRRWVMVRCSCGLWVGSAFRPDGGARPVTSVVMRACREGKTR